MFDIGWQELFIVVAIAIIVVGPQDLPKVLKTITSYVKKARSIIRDFQSGIDEVTRESELEDIRNEAKKLAETSFNQEINEAVQPISELESEFSLDDKKWSKEKKKSLLEENPVRSDEVDLAERSVAEKEKNHKG